MRVRVQFYAQLRDAAGESGLDLDLTENITAGELLEKLYCRKPALRAFDGTILVGAGLEFVKRDYIIQGGDEISIMPPVQGG